MNGSPAGSPDLVSQGEFEIPERGRRRDFARNRDAILQAADECFVEQGTKAPIGVIAKRAGVAPATVYRHFPGREDLEKAVFDVRMNTYAAAVEQAQGNEDPNLAFRETIRAIVELQTRDHSFRDLIGGGQELWAESSGLPRFATALFAAFDRARREDVMREDVQNEDVMLLLIATEGIARSTAAMSGEALDRLVSILLDGVCGERKEIAGATLTWFQLVEVTKG